MGIWRSTDPTTWDDVDQIVIDETAPPPNVQGVPSNTVLLLAQAERGLSGPSGNIGSIADVYALYGKTSSNMLRELANKKFGALKLCRVIASNAVAASLTVDDGGETPVDLLTFTPKQGKGAFGNALKVTIAAGSSSGKKYTFQDTTAGTVLTDEVYDNVAIANIATSGVFTNSQIFNVAVLATSAEPANISATPLTSGSDGSVADSDYQTALALCEGEMLANIVVLDAYNSTRNGYLKTHVANTQDRMTICTGAVGDSKATTISAVGSLRDTDGRIIYAANWLQSTINGIPTYTNPAVWLASVISQLGPQIDPASKNACAFTQGATNVYVNPSRQNFIDYAAAGVACFEFDSDIGIKVRSGVVTQIADSSKITILRRRMADYLTNSAAKFLKNYQNAVNSKDSRTQAGGSILSFVQSQQNLGILPKDTDLQSGKSTLVDVNALNTNDSIAAGFFKILWRQRIFSSMRYIVLQCEIGESVVVTSS